MQQSINDKGINPDKMAKSFLKKPSKENTTLLMRLIGLTLSMEKWSNETNEPTEIVLNNKTITYNPSTKEFHLNGILWDRKVGGLAKIVDSIKVDENVMKMTEVYLNSFK